MRLPSVETPDTWGGSWNDLKYKASVAAFQMVAQAVVFLPLSLACLGAIVVTEGEIKPYLILILAGVTVGASLLAHHAAKPYAVA